MRTNRYVVQSLELHLFFGRIMKEHALFLEAGFTPADPSFPQRAEQFKRGFEALLSDAMDLSNGVVRKEVLESGEIVTEFTDLAERQTEHFTGIAISNAITGRALCLQPGVGQCRNLGPMFGRVHNLNRTALKLLDGLICFKENVLKCVLQGELFTLNYPLLIEHIIREAKLYRKYVQIMEQEGELPEHIVKETECFWNQIMMEHAQFIRGLLEPSEAELFCTADGFAKDYCRLLVASRNANDQTLTRQTLEQTIKFRDFKAAGAQGIQQCKIRSIILPLLADHVLREANHYIRLLKQ